MIRALTLSGIAALLALLAGVPPCRAAENPTPMDMEMAADYYESFKDTSGQTAEKLKKLREYYLSAKKEFRGDPKLQPLFSRLDEANLSGKLSSAYKQLDKFNSAAGKIDQARDFYGRYKPDENDPTRSLAQISNLIEDFQKLIPLPADVKEPMTKLLTFYAQAATAYADALKRIEQKMDEYRQGVIGDGGRSDVGSSEQIRQYGRQGLSEPIHRSPDILLFPPAEVWTSLMDGNASVWDGEKWHPFEVSTPFLIELYGYHLRGAGKPIATDRLIAQARNPEQVRARIEEARAFHGLLSGIKSSRDRERYALLDSAGMLDDVDKLLADADGLEGFIGTYLYSTKDREAIVAVRRYLDTHVGVSGTVLVEEDNATHGLSGVTVSGGGASVRTGGSGSYTLILAQKLGTTASVTARHQKYPAAQRDVLFDAHFVSGYDLVLNRSEGGEEALLEAQQMLTSLEDLLKQFDRYYDYFMRMVRHGSSITSPTGGGVGSSAGFGGQMGRVLAYPFVQAEKKLEQLLLRATEFDAMERRVNEAGEGTDPAYRNTVRRLEQIRGGAYGPQGAAERFRQMRTALWQYNVTEEHLRGHAEGIPDDLQPEFAVNLIGTDGETPASR